MYDSYLKKCSDIENNFRDAQRPTQYHNYYCIFIMKD